MISHSGPTLENAKVNNGQELVQLEPKSHPKNTKLEKMANRYLDSENKRLSEYAVISLMVVTRLPGLN